MLKSALCRTVLTALAFCATGTAWRAEAATYFRRTSFRIYQGSPL